MARPFSFTPEIGAELNQRHANGESILKICKDEHMPYRGRVYEWVADGGEREELRDWFAEYQKARVSYAMAMADDVIEISDDTSNDTVMGGKEGDVELANHEWISRSKLKVDTRMKLMGKFAPAMFGDSIALTGAGGGAIKTEEVGGRDLGRRLAFTLMAGLAQNVTPPLIEDGGDGDA